MEHNHCLTLRNNLLVSLAYIANALSLAFGIAAANLGDDVNPTRRVSGPPI
ncbi:MAG TPA: hypothetical protein V6D19_24655 [Stenomitos sp.]